jgi:8-oxo-dGTP pyrophosphatase MutT (NUDIX family)
MDTLSRTLQARSRRVIDPVGFSRAAVLIPLVVTPDGHDLLFTRRTEEVETHKGQVSFPGGMLDGGDRDVVDAALRETEEEIGLDRRRVKVLGMLDDLTTPSGFLITPVVGIVRAIPPLRPNAAEVAEVFRVPLEFFADARNGRKEVRIVRGSPHDVWFYERNGNLIWGATASMVRSLIDALGLLPPAS